jgi:hypothetical protein
MYFPYGAWRDAEREAKRLPPSDNNGCAIIATIFIGGILAFGFFSSGGIGILFGCAVIIGMIQSLKR